MQSHTIVRVADLIEQYKSSSLLPQLRESLSACAPDDDVALFESDASFEHLSLDYGGDFPDTVRALFFASNLNVTGSILNENTDGAIGLVVLGDLVAKNVVIGGQITHVCGDVSVSELLCGSYNHGSMRCEGRVSARLLVSDDYQFLLDDLPLAAIAATGCDSIGLLEGRSFDPRYTVDPDADDGIGYAGARWIEGFVPLDQCLLSSCFDDTGDDLEFIFSSCIDLIKTGATALRPEFIQAGNTEPWLPVSAQLFYSAAGKKHHADAIALYERALAAGFPAQNCHFKIADLHYDHDEYAESLAHWTRCIELGFDVPGCRAKRSSSLLSTDPPDYVSAELDAHWIIARAGECPDYHVATAHNLLGYSLRRQARYAEAIPHLQAALSIDLDHENALVNLASCFYQLDRLDEALPVARKAKLLDPAPDMTTYILAKSLAATGDIDGAIATALVYQKHEPDWIHGWTSLADWYASQGRKKLASASAKKALALNPNSRYAQILVTENSSLLERILRRVNSSRT